jgi:hypothetical protein
MRRRSPLASVTNANGLILLDRHVVVRAVDAVGAEVADRDSDACERGLVVLPVAHGEGITRLGRVAAVG